MKNQRKTKTARTSERANSDRHRVPVAERGSDLTDLGVEGPRQGSLADVALRAALGTGAGVRMIPGAGGPRGGIGAILRWRD